MDMIEAPCIDVLCEIAFASKDVATMVAPEYVRSKAAARSASMAMPKHDDTDDKWHAFLGLCVLGGALVALPSLATAQSGELAGMGLLEDTEVMQDDGYFQLRGLTSAQAARLIAEVMSTATRAVCADPRRESPNAGWVTPELGAHLEQIEDGFKVNVLYMLEAVLNSDARGDGPDMVMDAACASRDFAVTALDMLLKSPENWPLWFARLVLVLRGAHDQWT